MIKKYSLVLIALLCFVANGFGQIETIDFETDLSKYSHNPSQTPTTDAGDRYFHRAIPSDATIYEGSVGPYTNVTGSWMFVGSNPNTINSGNPGVLTLDPINVSSYTNLELSIDWGAVPNDWDNADDLRVEYNFDGAGWNTLYSFQSQATTNNPLDLFGNATGGVNTANGTTLTYALQTITSDNFIGSGTNLNIRIVCDSNANYEAFGLDNIVLNGTNGPEINVSGNNISIPSGNGIPELSLNNYTILGNSNVNNAELISKSFVINNIGNQPLNISNITLSGPDSADFAIASPTTLSIPGGSSSALQIEFLPLTIGDKDAVITISHNDVTGSETPYIFSIRGIGVDYIICTSDLAQTIAIQDFENTPSTPTWSYTNTEDFPSTVSVAGGTGYGSVGDGGSSDLFLNGKSFQLNNTVNTTWAYAYLNFDSIDTQSFEDIELSIRLGAFSKSNTTSGLDGDDVVIAISEDNGASWSDEVQVTGNINSRWSFTSGTGIASVVYDNNNTIETAFTPSAGGFQTTEGYSTIKVTGLPSVSNLKVRITLRNNRFDEIWAIDNVILTGKTPSVKTWDGSNWRNVNNNITTAPTSSQKAIFAGAYNTATFGSIETCDCEVNTGVTLTINDNTYVEVQNNIKVDGNIIVNAKGSFIQINNAALVTGAVLGDKTKITVEKETAPMDNWYEYTYWSSPVSNETIDNGLSDADTNRRFKFSAQDYRDSNQENANLNTFSPGQDDIDDDPNYFSDGTGIDWQLISGGDFMTAGVGYASAHNSAIFNASPCASNPDPNCQFIYTFNGSFNNGVKTVPLYRNDEELNDNNWNLIGNPYPSAISADAFLNYNADITNAPNRVITGAIYLWSQNTAPSNGESGNEGSNFSQSDYAIINGVGETASSSGGDGSDPSNRMIPSGQAFFIAMSNTAPGTTTYSDPSGDPGDVQTKTVEFNNSMRVKGVNDNSQFFSPNLGENPDVDNPNNETNRNLFNKLKIDLNSEESFFGQILIGYINGATNADDGMYYDAPRNLSSGQYSTFYSIIPGSDNKFAILGKSPESLTVDEIIPLGFYTSINEAAIYTFSIAQLDGTFMNQNNIFIKDNLLNITHNLKELDYNFTSEVGEFNSRFEVVFTNDALSISETELNSNALQIIELQNGNVQFKVSSQYEMKSIKIIDLLGRTLYELDAQGNSQIFSLSNLSQATYLAKVELTNGLIITKKAIKRK